MQQTYDTIQQYIVDLINKYRYQHFNGPLTASNISTLVELSKSRDPSKIYDVLNKFDMEVRINYLEIMKYLANPYTIDNKKTDYVYSIFTWEDYKVFNSYRQLKEKDKQKLWKLFLKADIYFECLSPDLLLLGFKLDKQYTFVR
jgi:hypothetical protein